MSNRHLPSLADLLATVVDKEKPVAFVVAGHNGSGKSTLWRTKIAPLVKLPLVNADRLIMSILPEPQKGNLESWASALRDNDERWQRLAQSSVAAFQALIMDQKMAFGIETVFSHWVENKDGTVESKIDTIKNLQKNGYLVVLIFVGLTSVELSEMRVAARRAQGGHTVPANKLRDRFPRTQKAVREAAKVADYTMMFDNSLGLKDAFSLARVQRKTHVIYDCREATDSFSKRIQQVARIWLDLVSPLKTRPQSS